MRKPSNNQNETGNCLRSAVRCQLSGVVKPLRGFTLIEFLLYFALLAIVMTAVTSFAIDVVRGREKGAVVVEVEQNARLVLQRVLRAVRQATKLNVGASTLDSDAGLLSLDMSSAPATPTIFDLSGGVVRIKEGSGTATPLTSPDVTVTKLRFSKDNLGGNNVAVTVEMTTRYIASTDRWFDYTSSTSGTAVIRKD